MNKARIIWIIVVIAAVVGIMLLTVKYGGTKQPAPVTMNNATTSSPSVTASASGTHTLTMVKTTFTPSVVTSVSPAKRSFQNSSYSFSYPANWTIGASLPTSLNNFGAPTWQGGNLPRGGSEIAIATTSLYGSLSEMVSYDFRSMTNVTTNTVAVSGISCTVARGKLIDNSDIAEQEETIYCPRNHEVWKLYFSYRMDDPDSAAHASVFKDLLASLKFLP